MREVGGLHYFGHTYLLKSPFTEQAESLPHNALVFGGGLG
jgi:hypothetical protein